MKTLIAILVALAFGITGGLIVSAAFTAKISLFLAMCQIGLSCASTCFGTVLLINFKDA